jgi:hypothetical protein
MTTPVLVQVPHTLNSDFYVAAATIIPLLFIALAVEGHLIQELLAAFSWTTRTWLTRAALTPFGLIDRLLTRPRSLRFARTATASGRAARASGRGAPGRPAWYHWPGGRTRACNGGHPRGRPCSQCGGNARLSNSRPVVQPT